MEKPSSGKKMKAPISETGTVDDVHAAGTAGHDVERLVLFFIQCDEHLKNLVAGLQSRRLGWKRPAQAVALDECADHADNDGGDQKRGEETKEVGERVGEIGAKHEEAGVREVEDAHHREDQRQPT